MKKIIALAALAALTACSQAEEAENTDTMADGTSVTEQEPAMTAEAPASGDYMVAYEDGTEVPFTMNADGTWTGQDGEGATQSGTYEQRDGKTCFVTDPPSDNDSCWTNAAVGDDGSWTSTSDAGVTVTVRPAAAE